MKVRACVALLALTWMCSAAVIGVCGEKAQTPIDMVRELSIAQAQMAEGDSAALAAQRSLLEAIRLKLMAVDPASWMEPGNVRAAVAYALSGGDPRVLRAIIAADGVEPEGRVLARGALAYGEGRMTEARDLLSGIDARSLGPVVAGHLSLVQSELAQGSDRARAMALLDDARLLAPGTLVEEAALRRQVKLAANLADWSRFGSLSSQYLRRFAKSVYAEIFRQQFIQGVADQSLKDGAGLLASLKGELQALEKEQRRDLYLSVARECAASGNVAATRYAAHEAAVLSDAGSPESERARVYEGAALVVSSEFEAGLSALQAANRAALGHEDEQLLGAALSVARSIRPSFTTLAMPDMERLSPGLAMAGVETDKASPLVQLARSRIAKLDQMLGEITE